MSDAFFQRPILNSPYERPTKHWELAADGQPTQKERDGRREVRFVTPIPAPRKKSGQEGLGFNEAEELTDGEQRYEKTAETIRTVRRRVDAWRKLPETQWKVTPETARLLHHWRRPQEHWDGPRPFFCQREAAEVAIWLTEVAPQSGVEAKALLEFLHDANEGANPGLPRLALKLATGAGKTTVMAMLIAWQTVNAARRPSSKNFTRGFLIVTPGLTIKDRLRVLQPNDPDNYYETRGLVPRDLLPEVRKATVVITNYHTFQLRETMEVSRGGRALLQGRTGEEISSKETPGQMLRRVLGSLMGLRGLVVINDEAHHCYRGKPEEQTEEGKLTGDELQDAKSNDEAARVWISGLETVHEHLKLARIYDLSATPFFLRGSGYAEGTLFPWTMSDFSLMDAIECGIVKLPRVPVADNLAGAEQSEMPKLRELWKHIGKAMPKGNRKNSKLDPEDLPLLLQTALQALYGHYEKTHAKWEQAARRRGKRRWIPPCFIVVCNNTATSKLVHDWIAGWTATDEDGNEAPRFGRLELFRNTDGYGQPLARPRTLLIDSAQLESGEAIDKDFREAAADEIDRFRQAELDRGRSAAEVETFSDADLLREVMNTVGQEGGLGEQVRCVVSVAMLTEGWDANNVTHVLGVRAFGTQLLCEQVMGRALRRQSYQLGDDGLFGVEYADVLGIPFDFTAEPVVAPVQDLPQRTLVRAVKPERDPLAIRFPHVRGYRTDFPDETLKVSFRPEDSVLKLTPELVGPTITQNAGIIGEAAHLDLSHTADTRKGTILMHLASHLVTTKLKGEGGRPNFHLLPRAKAICSDWMDGYLKCVGGTHPAQLLYKPLAEDACQKIFNAITRGAGEAPVLAVLDPYNPEGSTASVHFQTSKQDLWDTAGFGGVEAPEESPESPSPACRNHVSHVVLDSGWEAEFCRVAETHPRVLRYVKNHGLGLEIPYRFQGQPRRYRPDFVVVLNDGNGAEDPLHLLVEVKGYRTEDAKEKRQAAETFWVPGVNRLGGFGRWAFAEFGNVFAMQEDFAAEVEKNFEAMVEGACGQPAHLGGPAHA
ncbi:BPTD_3080 family restriction endonuclease [Phycisphaera mikurensis]|uniref:Putative restriction endonuclease n=1 Tax=Phycisphaera mikurensis (strain NBRC 102666 / KCTC 22515 / FYK2301M01) TaxID=1142394 RepID=I0IAN6_PHYMF|nr:DEAD/DEAH box helicase family protein [Phycisphaera mikurensis]MBB6441681.1 type III restriction enzyme [Phycisphaera mikurensis]BAM02324.1 putative restriction endonuclease [Phycisphaera mikurensis NBRC 102666]